MKVKNRFAGNLILTLCLLAAVSISAAAQGGIGSAVSKSAGNEPYDLSEKMVKAIAEGRNQEALAMMTGKALSDFTGLLNNSQAPMEKIIPQDWRIVGESAGETGTERRTLVQMKLDGEWAAFWFTWTKIDGAWKFTDSEKSDEDEDIFRLNAPDGQMSGDPEAREAVDKFFAAMKAADIDSIRKLVVWNALLEFDDHSNSEDFAQDMEAFSTGVTYKVRSVRIPAAARNFALVNIDVTVAGDLNEDEYMLLLNSGDNWRIAEVEADPEDFEELIAEFSSANPVTVDAFTVGTQERAVFLAFEKIMEAFVAVDTQMVLNMTTGEAHESFIKMIGDEEGIEQFKDIAPSYRYQIIDISIDPTQPERAEIHLKYTYGDQDWDDGQAVMLLTAGVWKLAETK